MEPEQFDYVVVGAGSSGAVLASRLAENGKHTVILLEAGSSRQNDFWITTPIGIGKILHDERYVWPSSTCPQSALAGQRIYWPHGRIVGGSSSVNGMLHVRGEPAEYDHWRELGNKGWGYDDLLPYFTRLENLDNFDLATRGTGGPINVTDLSTRSDKLSAAFIRACINTGIPANNDYNGRNYEGVSYLQMSVRNGRRCGTAAGYLKNTPANLEIRTGCHASRVIFDGRTATGVEYERDQAPFSVSAGREVLICCGPIKSPQLLELSGIGDAEKLKPIGIQVVQHLAGVGENLIDHLQSRINYRCAFPITINDRLNSRMRMLAMGAGYLLTRRGVMATSGASVHALARANTGDARPTVKIQLHHLSAKDRYSVEKGQGLDPHSGFSFGFFPLRPRSRGSIHITSQSHRIDPLIDPAYLTEDEDVSTTINAFRLSRAIGEDQALSSFVVAETLPGSEIRNDDEVLAYIKESGQTSWHPIGTCRMGDDPGSVVTPDLRVRGMRNLRIVDSSIMPTMPSSNINIPAIMIGEKAADLVKSCAGS